jgi:large subunit ribosomal protein L1
MAKRGKKYRAALEKLGEGSPFSLQEGLKKVKGLAFAKFDESVDAHVDVGIDPSKGDQVVRGSVVLPFGAGKKVRVIVFAKGDYADQALKAGADAVGAEDLIEKVSDGWLDFDFAIATPDLMGKVGVLAKILGPRGLLPNKKIGTVTFDVGPMVKELKQGRMFFKNDKSAIVHVSFGKVSFEEQKLEGNLCAFVKALNASKPASSKGKFIRKITIASTMGVAVLLNVDDILKTCLAR